MKPTTRMRGVMQPDYTRSKLKLFQGQIAVKLGLGNQTRLGNGYLITKLAASRISLE